MWAEQVPVISICQLPQQMIVLGNESQPAIDFTLSLSPTKRPSQHLTSITLTYLLLQPQISCDFLMTKCHNSHANQHNCQPCKFNNDAIYSEIILSPNSQSFRRTLPYTRLGIVKVFFFFFMLALFSSAFNWVK